MKSIFLFRSNLRILEDYYKARCVTINEFEKECSDFWILQLIEFLKQDEFDEAIVWRLKPKNPYLDSGFSFMINNKMKILRQKFVDKFEDIFNPIYNNEYPLISFFRGGFPEYDKLVNAHGNKLGMKLYCGTGKRVYPQYGGIYDKILIEDDSDYKPNSNCIYFYKTASPNHFFLKDTEPIYDICFISNWTQKSYKGQEFFIKKVSKSDYLKSLNIIHLGNNPEVGEHLCEQYNVTNITFAGHKSKSFLNAIINKSKFGLVCSNQNDGCPRVITEILSCGTPLLLRSSTRLLNYYKSNGIIEFRDNEIENTFKLAFESYDHLKQKAIFGIDNLSLKNICKKNIEMWK